jgi:predicted RNA-binding Zn-ribbon protein involved in translation (DUF1610 family)
MSIFSLFSKKFRCPNCGSVANHSQVVASESDKDVDEMMASILGSMPNNSITRKEGEDAIKNGEYRCDKCSEVFTKYLSDTWKKIADKYGENLALEEYKNS